MQTMIKSDSSLAIDRYLNKDLTKIGLVGPALLEVLSKLYRLTSLSI